MTHTHTHTHGNQHSGHMYSHRWSHTPRHAHTHTHTDIGIGTMGLPSLQAMGVCVGGGAFLASHVCYGGGGLRAVGGQGGGQSGVWEGVLFFLSQVFCFMH